MRQFIGIILLITICSAALPVVINPSYSLQYADFGASGIAALIGLALSLAGTGAQMASQSKAAKEAKKHQKELEKRRSDYDAWFNSEYNRDYLDTEMGRASINQIGQTLKNTMQTNQNAAVRGGATPEAQIAAQGQAQGVFADALNRLSSQGTQYKQNLRNAYDYRIQSYLQPLDNLSMMRMQNWSNLGQQVGQTASGLNNALAMYDWESAFGQ